jgi:hypothetical protein
MAEVKLGQLALDKGSSDGVKEFGQKIVDDHTKANSIVKPSDQATYESSFKAKRCRF